MNIFPVIVENVFQNSVIKSDRRNNKYIRYFMSVLICIQKIQLNVLLLLKCSVAVIRNSSGILRIIFLVPLCISHYMQQFLNGRCSCQYYSIALIYQFLLHNISALVINNVLIVLLCVCSARQIPCWHPHEPTNGGVDCLLDIAPLVRVRHGRLRQLFTALRVQCLMCLICTLK